MLRAKHQLSQHSHNNRSHHILEKYNHNARQSRANYFMFQFCEIKMTYIDIRVLGHSGGRSWIKMEYPSETMPLGIPNQTPSCPQIILQCFFGVCLLACFCSYHSTETIFPVYHIRTASNNVL